MIAGSSSIVGRYKCLHNGVEQHSLCYHIEEQRAWRSGDSIYSSRPALVTITKSQASVATQKKPMIALLPRQELCNMAQTLNPLRLPEVHTPSHQPVSFAVESGNDSHVK